MCLRASSLITLLLVSPLVTILGFGSVVVVYSGEDARFPMRIDSFEFRLGEKGEVAEIYFMDSPGFERLPSMSYSELTANASAVIDGKVIHYNGRRAIISQERWTVLLSFNDGAPLLMVRDFNGILKFVVALPLKGLPDDFLRAILAKVANYLEGRQAAVTVLITTLVATTASVISYKIYEKYLKGVEGAVAAPLYVAASAVKIKDPLKSKTRKILYEELKREPLTVKELREKMELSKSSLLWHLGVLERSGLIKSEVFAGTKYYYVPGKTFDVKIKAMAMNPTRLHILRVVADKEKLGGAYLRELAKELGMSTESIKRNLDFLESIGLISSSYVKGKRYVKLTEMGRALVESGLSKKKFTTNAGLTIKDKVNLTGARRFQGILH